MRAILFTALIVSLGHVGFASTVRAASFASVIGQVQPKMVKIRGAGGLSGLEPYQSGFLISAEGHVLTAWSYVLDSDTVGVTLDDGRRFEAQLVGADPALEIAILKIEGEDLQHFKLDDATSGAVGQRVLAFSNMFGVAAGDEPVSVVHGQVSAVTELAARRGAYESPYQGQVYVLDAMTNNPGAAGGALTDSSGRLLGMLGKELRDSRTNIWLNYAIPVSELATSVAAIREGKSLPTSTGSTNLPDDPVQLASLGIALVPDVLERTPPYIDGVLAGSPAAKAGLRPDDLIVLVGEQVVQSCSAVSGELRRIESHAEVKLTVLRAGELVPVSLKAVSE